MSRITLASWMAVSVFFLALSGCAGKDKPSPVDIETAAFEDLRSEVLSVINDPDRSEQALAIVDELQLSFNALRTHLAERRVKIGALNADYDASREDITAAFNGIQSEMASNQQQISALHRQLAEMTTADEWARLAKSKSATMDAAISSIRAI